jgi:hypothetical protein
MMGVSEGQEWRGSGKVYMKYTQSIYEPHIQGI